MKSKVFLVALSLFGCAASVSTDVYAAASEVKSMQSFIKSMSTEQLIEIRNQIVSEYVALDQSRGESLNASLQAFGTSAIAFGLSVLIPCCVPSSTFSTTLGRAFQKCAVAGVTAYTALGSLMLMRVAVDQSRVFVSKQNEFQARVQELIPLLEAIDTELARRQKPTTDSGARTMPEVGVDLDAVLK
jgi:hypothetical protein